MPAAIVAAIIAAGTAAGQAGVAKKTADEQKKIFDEISKKYADIPTAVYSDQRLESFNPEKYGLPADISFETLKRDPATRQKLMNAIEDYRKMADQNISSQGDLDRAASTMDAEQGAAARSAGIRTMMQSSGRGGSGLEYGLQDQENQAAANRRYMGGLQAANNAQTERLNALKGYSSALAQDENTDLGLQEKNATTINTFNKINRERKDNINKWNTDLTNDAQLRNNALQQWNMLRGDANANSIFSQNMAKAGGAAQAMGGKSTAIGDEGSNYAAALGGLSKMAGTIYGGYASGGDGKKKKEEE